MTTGSPLRLICAFAIPLFLGSLFQQFYSLVDTMIVGRILGIDALAAVGATSSLNYLVVGFCTGTCNGLAIPLAQRFGAKDERGLRSYTMNAVYLAALFAVVITVLLVVFCHPILHLMQTPENIHSLTYTYIIIIFAGIPMTFLYNMIAAILRAVGDSRTPVLFLVFSSLLNIALDLFLIVTLDMGVAGAAVATVVAQGVSGILCVFYCMKKFEILHMTAADCPVNLSHIKVLCKMAIPMGMQYSITSIGGVILQSAVNTLGSVAVASIAAANKIGAFFANPFESLGTAMATYSGQNIGAGKPERITAGIRAAAVPGIAFALFGLAVSFFFGRNLALLFVDAAETEVVENVYIFLVVNGLFYIPLAFINILRYTIQGLGYSGTALFAGVFEMAGRSLTGLILVPMGGYMAACFSSPIAWILAILFLIPAFITVFNKVQKMQALDDTL